jgi:hypothetical protein
MNKNLLKAKDRFRNLPPLLKMALMIFILLVVFISIQGYRAATRAVTEINNLFRSDDSLMIKMIQYDPLFEQIRNESYLQTRLRMAASDSIILYINLMDSTISMSLKGVTVYDHRLERFAYSKLFDKIDRSAKVNLLSSPLIITTDTANIPKENYKTVKAPKNEEEANLLTAQIIPDTTREQVAVRLVLENGMIILMEQDPKTIEHNSRSYRKFVSSQRRKGWVVLWKDLFSLEVPEYHPWIKLYLPPEEVKNIYRALPRNGTVVLKI